MSFPLRQVAVTGLLAVLALVGVSFARVVIVEYQLHLQKQALERGVANLQSDNQALEIKIAYLQTDPAIEALAREELGWTMPGDTAVVVSGTPSPAPSMTPVAPDSSRAVHASWWDGVKKVLTLP
ncbi:MAG: FtsB family cell division protein [Chloroflexota bacterium]